jgi:hypothetical protein
MWQMTEKSTPYILPELKAKAQTPQEMLMIAK